MPLKTPSADRKAASVTSCAEYMNSLRLAADDDNDDGDEVDDDDGDVQPTRLDI